MLKKSFPNYSDEELKQVDGVLEQYAILVLRIYDRLCADPEWYTYFKDLTSKRE